MSNISSWKSKGGTHGKQLISIYHHNHNVHSQTKSLNIEYIKTNQIKQSKHEFSLFWVNMCMRLYKHALISLRACTRIFTQKHKSKIFTSSNRFTCSNCHKGPTQIHKQQMGLSPIKNLERFSQKLRTPTHFRKIPTFENPN